MPVYNIQGWVWSGIGNAITLLPVAVSDNDARMSPYFRNDFSETVTIGGTTYTNPRGGTYELTFTDSGGTSFTEDFLLWYTGGNFIFAPLPGSAFDTGSVVTGLGGWQDWRTGFRWTDVTCFCADTLISTVRGRQPVDTIAVGDRVKTPNGFHTVRWVGCRVVRFGDLAHRPKLRPVRIMAGALGNGLPERDLLVSRQHRMLVQSKIAERMFGVSEVLVPAIKLTELPGIFVDETVESVEYFHLLFDKHEVIYAEGAPTESLFTGPEALQAISPEAREEILTLFPEVADLDYEPEPARFIPHGKQQKQLVARHVKNSQPLITRPF